MMSKLGVSRALVPILFGTVLAACTLITNESSTQCRSQQDCLDRGPDFADTTCTAARVCEKITVTETACSTNQQCIDRFGGAPAFCRRTDGVCTKLASPACQNVYAEKSELLDDNTVFIGATVPNVEVGFLCDFAVQLARNEINHAGGLAPLTPGGPRRKLGIVMCQGDNITVEGAQAQFDFLAKQLQVPAALASIVSARALQAANTFIGTGAVDFVANSIPELSDVTANSNGLVYRTAFSEGEEVKALTPLLTYLTPQLVTEGQLQPGEAPRVAVMRDLGEGLGLANAVAHTLKINGVGVDDPSNANNFKIFDIGDSRNPVDHPNPDSERAAAINAAVQFKPNLVVITGGPSSFPTVWTALNRAWPAGAPRFYSVPTLPSLLTALVATATALNNDEARRKIIGLRGIHDDFQASDVPLFETNLRIAFPQAVQPTTLSNWVYYDSVYMFAYSVAAIGNAPLTGTQLRSGVRKVAGAGGGVQINWGPGDYAKALGLLAGGNQISYRGVAGTYNLDDKGETHGYIDLWCMPTKAGKPAAGVPSGLRYDPRTDAFSGTFNCPTL